MASIDEYAQLSSQVYSAVFNQNRTSVAQGWKELYWQPDTTTVRNIGNIGVTFNIGVKYWGQQILGSQNTKY